MEILESIPDRILASQIAYQALDLLKQSPEASKHVYLVLSTYHGSLRCSETSYIEPTQA